MNQEKYTDRMRGFLQSAQMLALREGHQRFIPDHLLKVLLDDPEGLAANLIPPRAAIPRRASRGRGDAGQAAQGRRPGRGPALHGARDRAPVRPGRAVAKKAGDTFVTVERMLLALALAKGTDAAKALQRPA